MSWETVIGLEIHAQLATDSKIFSGASTAFGTEANRQACAVDLGLPGVLPVLNRGVVEMAVRFALATDAEIGFHSQFERKNYFYPDLPKGYQISQMKHPIVGRGQIEIAVPGGESKTVGITRAHLEEDAGKSVHDLFPSRTGIDLNRAGTPLLEIVSEPDLRSAAEAAAYARQIHALVRWIGICDGNMQEGSFRCDANVSIRQKGDPLLGTRTEVKNINSFRFLERAIEFEIDRQIDVLESGREVVQETRLYDADKDETRSMRSKEEANDYRYFPDPDLPPLVIDEAFVAEVKSTLPELPVQRRERFVDQLKLRPDDARALTVDRLTADWFEAVLAADADLPAQQVANWMQGELFARLNRDDQALTDCPLQPAQLAGLIKRVEDGTLSNKLGKEVFDALWGSDADADSVIKERGLEQISDSGALEALVDQVIADNPAQLEQYRAGKDKLLGYFVGQVMKASQGKANPAALNALLQDKLKG